MAFMTDTHSAVETPSIFAKITGAIGRFFAASIEANGRGQLVRELQSKSDRQLADMGIAREDIVRFVFRDKIGM